MMTLSVVRGLVIIDEVQRMPELFPVLRVLLDRPDNPARFLLLGSASPQLVRGVSESLAGRVALLEMGGFDSLEVGADHWRSLWVRGGFPRSYLAPTDTDSMEWRGDFIQTFLERDLPQLGLRVPPVALRRFWNMLGHYHGQVWNAADFARSLGVSQPTVRSYLDILTGAFFVRQLPPWFENVGKRQVKSPKTYLRDTGILHALLGLPSWEALTGHPKLGASWEAFALEQVLRWANVRDPYFWATHAGAELDLFILRDGQRLGFEFKFQDAPTTTKSMRVAIRDLALAKLLVVHPGEKTYPLDDGIEAVPLTKMAQVFENW